ncbi:putative uncharacterized oxidoreductase YGL039W isoform X2 [Anneissia japonica]|uniref:putative uncharacterized oxidoreductase YGL039W isoform X1 n=1 Tax=Anneissia japonica TaxID=1529436 RepID=UPI001425AB30|nr:putative uncharacterized oxidoreductase YGL039W isoform X1 [Anneissia japonica]XP_033107473.1 putative uncharacterized oxidoreductase YGL039W isoform X1 [Anneissia japonica]XP_033107474.1 putative uncharacterized oxidoreductase YGL039W isoform X2 [Anneissia japonica]
MAEKVEITKVLVTGATGFIAGHVIRQLQQNCINVRGTIRSNNDAKERDLLEKLCIDPSKPFELVEADVLNTDDWESAVEGCSHVIHLASPTDGFWKEEEGEMTEQAVQGTINILKACSTAGVKRVILTSSVLAVSSFKKSSTYSEKDWTDINEGTAYSKSKIQAEKAAWQFLKDVESDEIFELVSINPGFVLGPYFTNSPGCSVAVIADVLMNKNSRVPHIALPVCDVRDVAKAHVNALSCPEAAHNRHIIVSDFVFCDKIGKILASEFKSQGYNPTTAVASRPFLKFLSFFDSSLRNTTASWGIKPNVDTTRMREVLKITPISVDKTIIDMAYSLIQKGFLPEKLKFRAPEDLPVKDN